MLTPPHTFSRLTTAGCVCVLSAFAVAGLSQVRKLMRDVSPSLNIDRVQLVTNRTGGLITLELDDSVAVVWFAKGTDAKNIEAAVLKLNYDIGAGKVVFHAVVDGVVQDVVAVDKVYVEVAEDEGGRGAAATKPGSAAANDTAPPVYTPARDKSQAGVAGTTGATPDAADGGDPADDDGGAAVIVGVLCAVLVLAAAAVAAFHFGRAKSVRQGNGNGNGGGGGGMRGPGVTVTNRVFVASGAGGGGVYDMPDAPPPYDDAMDQAAGATVYTNKTALAAADGVYADVDAATPSSPQQIVGVSHAEANEIVPAAVDGAYEAPDAAGGGYEAPDAAGYEAPDAGVYTDVDAVAPGAPQQSVANAYAEVSEEAAYMEPTPLAEQAYAGFDVGPVGEHVAADAPEGTYLQPGEVAFAPMTPAAGIYC